MKWRHTRADCSRGFAHQPCIDSAHFFSFRMVLLAVSVRELCSVGLLRLSLSFYQRCGAVDKLQSRAGTVKLKYILRVLHLSRRCTVTAR